MINEPECDTNPTSIEPNVIESKIVPKPSVAVRSLKQMLNETRAVEIEFFERVYELETEFQNRHELVYRKRCEIINGDYIPTEAEGLSDNDPQYTDDQNKKDQSSIPGPQAGVPNFWLSVLTAIFSDIHEDDRSILEHLTDVRGKNKPLSDLGFILEFYFTPNEYFDNAVLRKEYFYTSSDNKTIHEVPLIRKSVGCEIKWKDGKVPAYRSWFDFLSSSKVISNTEEEFMSYITGIQKDFEMGYFIKEHVIPRAVLYFTGEEKHVFNVGNYTTGFWSALPSTSSESLTEDSISLEVDSKSGSENKTEKEAQNQKIIIATEEESKA